MPTAQVPSALTVFFSWGHDPFTDACKARTRTDVGWTFSECAIVRKVVLSGKWIFRRACPGSLYRIRAHAFLGTTAADNLGPSASPQVASFPEVILVESDDDVDSVASVHEEFVVDAVSVDGSASEVKLDPAVKLESDPEHEGCKSLSDGVGSLPCFPVTCPVTAEFLWGFPSFLQRPMISVVRLWVPARRCLLDLDLDENALPASAAVARHCRRRAKTSHFVSQSLNPALTPSVLETPTILLLLSGVSKFPRARTLVVFPSSPPVSPPIMTSFWVCLPCSTCRLPRFAPPFSSVTATLTETLAL